MYNCNLSHIVLFLYSGTKVCKVWPLPLSKPEYGCTRPRTRRELDLRMWNDGHDASGHKVTTERNYFHTRLVKNWFRAFLTVPTAAVVARENISFSGPHSFSFGNQSSGRDGKTTMLPWAGDARSPRPAEDEVCKENENVYGFPRPFRHSTRILQRRVISFRADLFIVKHTVRFPKLITPRKTYSI